MGYGKLSVQDGSGKCGDGMTQGSSSSSGSSGMLILKLSLFMSIIDFCGLNLFLDPLVPGELYRCIGIVPKFSSTSISLDIFLILRQL